MSVDPTHFGFIPGHAADRARGAPHRPGFPFRMIDHEAATVRGAAGMIARLPTAAAVRLAAS